MLHQKTLVFIFLLLILDSIFTLNIAAAKTVPLYYLQESTVPVFSADELHELEKQLTIQINQSEKIIRDPLTNEYLQHIAENLLQTNHTKHQKFRFFLVNDSQLNAFAGAGGLIGVNSGLILFSASESEVAAILAHEIAHVQQKHFMRTLQYAKQQNIPLLASSLAALALGIINPALGSGALAASLSEINENSLSFQRNHELEADRIGIKILHDANYDPENMANVFNRFLEQHRYSSMRNTSVLLQTHPLDEQRIADAKNRSAQYSKKNYRSHSSSYSLFRERIRILSNANIFELLHYYRAQLTQPNQPPAIYYGYALALIQANQHDKALLTLQKLLLQKPDEIFYQLALAEVYLAKKQSQSALTLLRDAYQKTPKQHAIATQYADLLLTTENLDEAINIMTEMLHHHPHSDILWNKLARAQAAHNQMAEAYFSQARAALLLQQFDLVKQYLQQGLQHSKHKPLMQARLEALLDEVVRKHG